jgi:hypothetical protein
MGEYLLQIHHAEHDEPIVIKLSDCGPDEAEIERQALARQIEHAAEADAPLLYPRSTGDGDPGPAIALDPAKVIRVDLVDGAEAGL